MEQPTEGQTTPFAFTSHQTALCLIPPRDIWPDADRLRCLYDKAYGAWPPHINVIYPFVRPEVLSDAADILSQLALSQHHHRRIKLGTGDAFIRKHHNTIFLRPDHGPDTAALSQLRDEICDALDQPRGRDYRPHMTIGQSDDALAAPHHFLIEKVRLLSPLAWDLGQIALLTRDATHSGGEGPRPMMLWATLDLSSQLLTRFQPPQHFYESPGIVFKSGDLSLTPKATAQPSFQCISGTWQATAMSPIVGDAQLVLDNLIVASYNVLAEFEWPPNSNRYPGLVDNLLSSRAAADVLVLQEVTDHFLPFLLANKDIRLRYPFATHGPPGQPNIGPLPSLLNVVVLSKFPLQWEHLPFQRKHKGCAVVQFPTIGTRDSNDRFRPWVLTACHLSQGLTDGAVVAKMKEVQRMLDHLSIHYAQHPWILAGDFNLATSSYTVDAARKKQDITSNTVQYLHDIDMILSNAGFQDTWLTTRLESGESSDVVTDYQSAADAYEGEQGATFNPFVNSLAAKLVGTGLNNRPQRYDRILIKPNNQYRPQGFNMFGQTPSGQSDGDEPSYASDHWGVRCLLVRASVEDDTKESVLPETKVHLRKAPPGLHNLDDLKRCLDRHGCLPTEVDGAGRKHALLVLENALLDADRPGAQADSRSGLVLTIVPVGSYGLGVWTDASDIDCLCIGSISSKTFFLLALQRLRKAASEGIKVLRRVKANSGYMLELEVCGIKVDLQYCAATSIAERWSEIMKRPSTDPVFALPLQALVKLKPARDLIYLRRSIPDMGQYRLAHLFIKAWARSRGIYAAKFGFLGGIHISVLLVPVCKMLACHGETVTASDIIVTFFHHYAVFDWKSQMVFDPFFHKGVRYNRTFREPLCLLGWHTPSLNTAVNASVPTVNAIAEEFSRAKDLLLTDSLTWDSLLSGGIKNDAGLHQPTGQGAAEFLQAYRSYVKIDAHYWGPSPEKGSRFIGWLESRCVMLLVDIDRKLKGILARIWPARFVDGSSAAIDISVAEYHGCYLVGLGWDGAESTKEQAKLAHASLQTVLQEFETRIRRDEKYFDCQSCWMSTSLVRAHDLDGLGLDQSRWGEDVGDSEDDDSEDDMDADDDDVDAEQPPRGAEGRLNKKAAAQGSKTPTPIKAPGLGKFRTAADVLNRLRWDGSLDINDYVVGYEDRFTGAQEKAVGQWKSEQTDEEFIPQHRILYFKRKSDGTIMWERRSRIDDIFGSGIKADG
ncbi:hypothetical protein BGZ61DRAFT_470180 [Ilyonectria robusta]|uniref:uncharacterized protein n=1 Tax=Ilyonectria robusta TaxID=1079257 RepID=UPI001E8E53B1|nr:uncharacterized protein BGZ61DRAFT_470180 [Ilyonectria robusta]KAH8736645.1 hypothetical protein BGZ61DRAFT_470180 [Ilyonectria robusta]